MERALLFKHIYLMNFTQGGWDSEKNRVVRVTLSLFITPLTRGNLCLRFSYLGNSNRTSDAGKLSL